ncbi:MAG: ABC-F family ATP-binding cassette domain-containing protein [Verrucomicrobiales bacterium]
MSALISATDLDLTYGDQVVLNAATLAVHEGDKVGLVGRNGCGKSSFLKILAGIEKPDSGQIATRNELVVGYLSQEFTLREDTDVISNIRDGAAHVLALIERFETGSGGDHDSLQNQIEAADGWNLDARIATAMESLGAPAADRRVSELSGGEKRRVALCRAIISRPDFLILDEPTNHLDVESITWLEQFLINSKAACLFVTHDRYFLDRIANRIVELANGTFFSHQGSYNDFLEAKAIRQGQDQARENKRQAFLRREIEWVRAGVKARTTKSRSRLDNFYEIESQTAPERELNMELIIPPAPRLGNTVVDAKGIGVHLDKRWLFADLDLEFEPGTCTGITGRNGLGKTTLLRTLMGTLEPTEGSVTIGKRTHFNYVDQARLQLDGSNSIIKEVGGDSEVVQFGPDTISIRSYLRRFLFEDDRLNMRIDCLSGGEQSRVLLAKILHNGGNFLVLDEPTNDLDLQTLRVLEEAILGFAGCVVVVSHERYFLDRVCDKIIAFEGSGQVRCQVGNFSYYQEKFGKRRQQPKAAAKPVAAKPVEKKDAPRKLKWKEERELESMEETIGATEARISEIEAKFADPDFYASNAEELPGLEEEMKQLKPQVDRLYARWEELEAIKSASEAT